MPINTLEYAQIFQKNLDKQVETVATSGWMESNSEQVIYNGGREIKIPKIIMDGLANYDKDKGYIQGSVSLGYETKEMAQDRGRTFLLDAIDVDETSFVATAGNVMGEFQRIKVVPEIDAYRYSSLVQIASAAGNVNNGGKLTAATALDALLEDLATIEDKGITDQLVVTLSPITARLLSQGSNWNNYAEETVLQNGKLNLKLQGINGAALSRTPQNRLMSAYVFKDGSTTNQTAGGFAPDSSAVAINWIISAVSAPIAVSKTDTPRIFDPMTNQNAQAWKIDYRKFHDIFVPDNQVVKVLVNAQAAIPAATTAPAA